MSAERTVGVLFGGPSAEHDVSCAFALALVRAGRFRPVAVGVTRAGEFRMVPDDTVRRRVRASASARAIDDRLPVDGRPVRLQAHPRGATVVDAGTGAELRHLDVVFPVLHGPYGEDGVLQGVLEALGVPYVGCGVTASAVGMDKVAMKRALRAEDVPVTPYVWFDAARRRVTDLPALVAHLRRPLFVKPARMGSSLGVTRVDADNDLPAAVAHARTYDSVVLVEEGVVGRELECGVLGGHDPQASTVGEVAVRHGFFDFDQKYRSDGDPMTVPAAVPPPVTKQATELAVRAFDALGCWGLARVDLLLDEATDRLVVNEVNTMPGFTAHSMYPKVWAACGVTYPDLVGRLIDLAVERHTARRSLRGSNR